MKNGFYNLLKILVDGKIVTSFTADDENKGFQKLIRDVVKENKALFRNYNINSHSDDEFYMEYLKNSIQYKSFTHALKTVLTLFHGHASDKRGFSLIH